MNYAEMLKEAVENDDIERLKTLADMVSSITEDADSTLIRFADGSSIRTTESLGILFDAND